MVKLFSQIVVITMAHIYIVYGTQISPTLLLDKDSKNETRVGKNFWIPIPWIPTVPVATTPPATGGLTAETIAFMNSFTTSQNTYRAQHGANPLVRDDALALLAQQCLPMYVTETPTFPVPPAPIPITPNCGVEGEIPYFNQREFTSAELTAVRVVDKFYDEKPAQLPQINLPDPVTAHFTQMVWKASLTYGCALAFNNQAVGNAAAAYFVSCIYRPAGNGVDFAYYPGNVTLTVTP